MTRSSRGFSLIELLVVIAIIGVLALAGYVAYTKYINEARDKRVLSEGKEIFRAIETDTLVAKMGRTTGGLSEGLTSENTCQELLDMVAENLNVKQQKTNPFNLSPLVQKTIPVDTNLARGSVYLSCATPSSKIDATDFYLQTCVCTGEGECTPELVPPIPTLLDKNICYRL